MSACPDCGFDLPDDGPCCVCPVLPATREGGLGPAGSGGRTKAAARSGPAGFLALTGRLLLPLLIGIACLGLGLLGFFKISPIDGIVAATGATLATGLPGAPDPAAPATASGADPASLVAVGAPVAASASVAAGAAGSPISAWGGARPGTFILSPLIMHSANFLDPDPRLPPSTAAREVPVAKHLPPLDSKVSFIAWMLAHTKEPEIQLAKKWDRSRALLARGEVKNKGVLEAFLYTPREYFARPYNAKKAYDDTAIPIGHGQTISGPHMVSHMTDSIAPLPGDRILEIGTGSGYQSAFLSELSDQVYTIEIVPALYAETDAIYRRLVKDYPEYANVTRKNADGYYGWPEHAPFDKIIVTAGIDHIPPPLLAQLAPGGIMVIPVGPPSGQTVLKVVKKPLPGGGFDFERSDIYHGRKVIFVPFTSGKGKAHSLKDAAGAE